MTYAEISQMLAAVGVPCAYFQFLEGTETQPPFITFYFDGSDDLMADDINYKKIRPLTIELYTDTKDFELESTVEDVLTANGLAFSRTEAFIESERMHMVTFLTEVMIDG